MKAIILKTKPYSMFRLGIGSLEENDKIIHSDTLFSAIVNIHFKVFNNTEDFIQLFENGNIKISSAFPMLTEHNGNGKIYFLPKPELHYDVKENIKAEKKVKFISLKVFNSFLRQDEINFAKNNIFLGSEFVIKPDEIYNPGEMPNFIKVVTIPKTKVHTSERENAFYHETDVQLLPIKLEAKKYFPHFYFFYELNNVDKKFEEEFFTCLKILGDEGIGGERSTGKGHFEGIIKTEISLNQPTRSDKQLLLSLFNPQNQDEFNAVENYNILIRGGGSISFDSENEGDEEIIKPYRKKQVRMIAEGAIIKGNVEGKLVDITPAEGAEHKFFRNGKSFIIPLG